MSATLPAGGRVHLIGIGGAGMSPLAWILLERGHPVSGSDLRGGPTCDALSAMGAEIRVGHAQANVEGAQLVSASTAIPASNPELVRARALGLPVLHRAELLAALIGDRRAVLISGTHGKTTTTSMATVCLQSAGLDPSFAIGGSLHSTGASAHHGTGPAFVAEADESDRSFVAFEPDCAVITNVELDHHDTYENLADVAEAFAAFLSRRRREGLAVLCRDDSGAVGLAEHATPPVLTYGAHPEADLRITDVALEADGSRFRLADRGEDLGPFRLLVPGRHNVLNATAAAAASMFAGAPVETVRDGLASFLGAQRRFQRLGTAGGVVLVDDYAHHPTELAAVLAGARQTRPAGRIVAVFQPHRYTRTAALGPQLGAALGGADLAVITDVYAAGERPVPGVTGTVVAEAAQASGVPTRYAPTGTDLVGLLVELVRPGDLVLTLGAGDITELGPTLLRRLEGLE